MGQDGGIEPKLLAGLGIESAFVGSPLYDSVISAVSFKLEKTAEQKAQKTKETK